MSREAMQMALEALEKQHNWMVANGGMFAVPSLKAISALRRALETEPFEYWNAVEGWVKIDEVREHFDAVGCGTIYKSAGEGRSPLYTAPPKQWVGLTDDEVAIICGECAASAHKTDDISYARAIEAKLKEKNT